MRTLRGPHPRTVLTVVLVSGAVLAGFWLTWLATVGGGPVWSAGRILPLPRGGALMAVTAVSEHDAWTVGFALGGTLQRSTLIEHWNGRTWQRLPSPDPAGNCCYGPGYGIGGPYLDGVAATSGRNAWAVGITGDYQSHGHIHNYSLIEHWNGTVWTRVPVSLPGRLLTGVAATSARNAWAVGSYARHPGESYAAPLVEHWDGRVWRQVPFASPPHGPYGLVTLNAIAATSARDAWVVGSYWPSGVAPLIEHWDGTTWRQVPSPSPNRGFELAGVTAISASNAWAVGASSTTGMTLIEHWDGRAWRRVPSPARAADGELSSVTGTPSCGVWAVGDTGIRYGGGSTATLVVRGNRTGSTWVPNPSLGGYTASFNGVAEASGCRPWAVGGGLYLKGAPHGAPLIERWNGTAWTAALRPR